MPVATSTRTEPLHLSPVDQEDIDRGDGDAIITGIEMFCTVSRDGFTGSGGSKLVLRPWQQDLIRRLFARRPDGRLKHRTALIGLPRKNGKSALGSALALDALIFGGTGAEVYSAAAEFKQARIVFDEAKRTVLGDSHLAATFDVMRDVITNPQTSSVYRVLTAKAPTKEGLNPSRDRKSNV